MGIAVFILTYLGMIVGNFPGLALDRTGVALLGALILIILGYFTSPELVQAINWETFAAFFGLMILSAQFYFSGFYSYLIHRVAKMRISPQTFLLLVILISGIFSAALINDIICLAMSPILIQVCLHKEWHPLPFLLGLAAASNVGSAITLIGNPQNILIGETMHLSFSRYFCDAALPSFLGLFWVWIVIRWLQKGRWSHKTTVKTAHPPEVIDIPFDKWQSIKGIVVLIAVLSCFFFSSLPMYIVALTAASIILLSRKMASKKMLGFVDWQLLVLFFGLFMVNAGFLKTGVPEYTLDWLSAHGVDLLQPVTLWTVTAILSNIVSNVPAVMLLLPFTKTDLSGSILALSSTLAGNLFLVGSIANLIVAAQAEKFGIKVTWKQHIKMGFPVVVGTFLISALWLYLRYS